MFFIKELFFILYSLFLLTYKIQEDTLYYDKIIQKNFKSASIKKIIDIDKETKELLQDVDIDLSINYNIYYKNLIPIEKNLFYGFCDLDGNIKIDYLFDRIEKNGSKVFGFMKDKNKNLYQIYIINEDGSYKKIFEKYSEEDNIFFTIIQEFKKNKFYITLINDYFRNGEREYFLYDNEKDKLEEVSDSTKIILYETNDRRVLKNMKDEYWLEDLKGNILSDIFINFIPEENSNYMSENFLFMQKTRFKRIKYLELVDKNGKTILDTKEISLGYTYIDSSQFMYDENSPRYDTTFNIIKNYKDIIIFELYASYYIPEGYSSTIGIAQAPDIVFYINKYDNSFIKFAYNHHVLENEFKTNDKVEEGMSYGFFSDSREKDEQFFYPEDIGIDFRLELYSDEDKIITSFAGKTFFLNKKFEIIDKKDFDLEFLEPLKKSGEIIYLLGGNEDNMFLFDKDLNLIKEIDYLVDDSNANIVILDNIFKYNYIDNYFVRNRFYHSKKLTLTKRGLFTFDMIKQN